MTYLFGRREFNPSKDLDEGMLQTLAEQTGGLYFRAKDTEQLKQIYLTPDQLEPISRAAANATTALIVSLSISIGVFISLLMCIPASRAARVRS